MSQKKDSKLAKEIGYKIHGGRKKFAFVYPNLYKVGMSNLGLHIIYQLLNSRSDIACERFFLPENTKQPLLSLETQTPLNKFQIVGFAISFEQDYFNVVKILNLSKIKVRSAERTNFDPEPLADIFDAFVIGEGEVILPALIDTLNNFEHLPRTELLQKISEVPGVYVPVGKMSRWVDEEMSRKNTTNLPNYQSTNLPIYPSTNLVKRQWLKNLDDFPAHSTIITDDTEFNMYLIETARGCGRHCRFCMAGYAFRKPRNRSLEVLKAEVVDAVKFNKKIGLMGAAISDYPQINELCKFILEKNLPMSVASFRADSVTFELVEALAKSGLKTLTIAPEVGSKKMCQVINKGITEENVFQTVELGLVFHSRKLQMLKKLQT